MNDIDQTPQIETTAPVETAPVQPDHPVVTEVKTWLADMNEVAPHHNQKTFFVHLMENIDDLFARLKKAL